MAYFEKNIASTILKTIHARPEGTAIPVDAPRDASAIAAQSAKLRPAQFSDYSAVTELKRRWNLTADSFENWERLWKRNPALAGLASAPPIGWVLETQSKIVGYLGNISSTYYFGDRKLSAVTSSGLVVEPAYRSVSLSLIAAFYRQPNVDIFLVTTAIPAVGKIARAFRSVRIPLEDYETVLFWVLRSYPFAKAVANRLGIPPALVPLSGGVGALAAIGERFLRNRNPRMPETILDVTEMLVDQIGNEFQSLWSNKLQEGPRLLADRTASTLRWHYQIPGDTGTTTVLCCREREELRGYAVVRSGVSRRTGLRRALLADMLVRNDDPEVIRNLLVAAHDHARQKGNDIFEVLGFPHNVRQVCSEGKPYLRKYPACPFYYKAANATDHQAFSSDRVWYATPFDGDTTLMP